MNKMASCNDNLVPISTLAKNIPESLFDRVEELVRKHEPVDLGVGFPDFDEVVKDQLKVSLVATQREGAPVENNQYCRCMGHPDLVRELAALYSDTLGRDIDASKEVLVTVGADESLNCILRAVVNPGDEVIILEPFYIPFESFVRASRAVPKFVTLKMKPGGTTSKDFVFDEEELKQSFNEKTKAIIVNSPHNPTGKIFSKDEITFIADLCKKHNCLFISDEVYEWIRYDKTESVRVASLPGMWNRTVTIGSAGKTFSVTGWKVGWSIGPEYLISAAHQIHLSTVACLATPIQIALADTIKEERKLLGTKESYWYRLVELLSKKRERLYKMLVEAGFKPILPQGGYCMMADVSGLGVNPPQVEGGWDELDQRISEWMILEKGIVALPVSGFYSSGSRSKYDRTLRFCFIKGEETLDAAEIKLKSLNINAA